LNDEGLYRWWQVEGTSMRAFIRDHREELDKVILDVVNRPPRERTWRDA
jgi:hypothetical protein